MIIYDDTTVAFIRKTEGFFKEILEKIGIKTRIKRFEFNRHLYPIYVVVFEGHEWGHFNAPYMQIGLNKKLIYLAKDSVVRDILKHELAHYLTYIRYGVVASHGHEFKETCRQYGFPSDIASATMDLEQSNLQKEGDLNSERIVEKIKKLLQLAQSSNVHEAELATIKANQLLLRHNLDNLESEDEAIYVEHVLVQTRRDSKMSAIYDILRHFVVRPVVSYGKNVCTLEVSGSLTNVKLARYVAEFLNRELDHMWGISKKEYGLQGLRAKNSFFLGVAKGFDEKMKKSKLEFTADEQQALVIVEKNLDKNIRIIYRRLSSSSSGHRPDNHAASVGILKGRSLTIRQGVEGNSKNLYLPY